MYVYAINLHLYILVWCRFLSFFFICSINPWRTNSYLFHLF